jgi:hypothetical protein
MDAIAQLKVMRDHGLVNVATIQMAAQNVGIHLAPACALMTMESSGRNVYGHDKDAALSGYPHQVDESNFKVYHWLVTEKGMTPNGVGPSQLTFMGFINDMIADGHRPWVLMDNMEYGFSLILDYRHSQGSWLDAATKYNGSSDYGRRFVASLDNWREWLA